MILRHDITVQNLIWLLLLLKYCESRILPSWFWESSSILSHFEVISTLTTSIKRSANQTTFSASGVLEPSQALRRRDSSTNDVISSLTEVTPSEQPSEQPTGSDISTELSSLSPLNSDSSVQINSGTATYSETSSAFSSFYDTLTLENILPKTETTLSPETSNLLLGNDSPSPMPSALTFTSSPDEPGVSAPQSSDNGYSFTNDGMTSLNSLPTSGTSSPLRPFVSTRLPDKIASTNTNPEQPSSEASISDSNGSTMESNTADIVTSGDDSSLGIDTLTFTSESSDPVSISSDPYFTPTPSPYPIITPGQSSETISRGKSVVTSTDGNLTPTSSSSTSDTVTPVTSTSVTPTSDTVTPVTFTPITFTPVTPTPDTVTPKTDTPKTDTPKTDTPKTDTQDTTPPVTFTSVTPTPVTVTPDTHIPDTATPATHTPETHTPETSPPPLPSSFAFADSSVPFPASIITSVGDILASDDIVTSFTQTPDQETLPITPTSLVETSTPTIITSIETPFAESIVQPTITTPLTTESSIEIIFSSAEPFESGKLLNSDITQTTLQTADTVYSDIETSANTFVPIDVSSTYFPSIETALSKSENTLLPLSTTLINSLLTDNSYLASTTLSEKISTATATEGHSNFITQATDSPVSVISPVSLAPSDPLNSATSMTFTVPIESGKYNPSTSSTSFPNWLPTVLVVETLASDAVSTTSKPNLGATSTLPQAINPATDIAVPSGYMVITIGLKEELNYQFLIANPLASAQVFNFLPKVLVFPFTSAETMGQQVFRRLVQFFDKREDVKSSELDISTSVSYNNVQVKSIVPLVMKKVDYIISIAEVIFPAASVPILQELILDENSVLYSNPENYLNNLAHIIDPSIPLTGLAYNGNPASSGGSDSNGPGSTGGSGNGNGNGTNGTNPIWSADSTLWGSLDAGFTGGFSGHIAVVRFICYLTVLTSFVIFLLVATLYGMRKLYNVSVVSKRLELPEKSWPYDSYTGLNHQFASDIDSPQRNMFYSGSDITTSSEDSTSQSSENWEYIDDDLIITGENTVYSISQGITYFVDEEGNFFFAGVGKVKSERGFEKRTLNDITKESSSSENRFSSKVFNDEYQDEQVNLEPYDMEQLEVDEEGNIVLPDSDLKDADLEFSTNITEAKSNTNLDTLAGSSSDHGNIFLPFSSVQASTLPSNTLESGTSGPILSYNETEGLTIPSDSGNYDEYLYDANQDELTENNVLSASTISETIPSLMSLLPGDDGIDIDIEDYDDDVSDVNIGDYDEFDEELYRHFSRSDMLPNFGSSTSTTMNTRIASLNGPSSDSRTSFNVRTNPESSTGAFTSTISSSVLNASDQSNSSIPPKRPVRPFEIFDFDGLINDKTTLDMPRHNLFIRKQSQEKFETDKSSKKVTLSKHTSKDFAAELGITEDQLKKMERKPSGVSVPSSVTFNDRRKSHIRSVVENVISRTPQHRSRSKTVGSTEILGNNTKQDVKNVHISGPLFSENSLGWDDV